MTRCAITHNQASDATTVTRGRADHLLPAVQQSLPTPVEFTTRRRVRTDAPRLTAATTGPRCRRLGARPESHGPTTILVSPALIYR
ncbi:hypothetical protein ACRAWF_43540 [Streptomyces sp. L7]